VAFEGHSSDPVPKFVKIFVTDEATHSKFGEQIDQVLVGLD